MQTASTSSKDPSTRDETQGDAEHPKPGIVCALFIQHSDRGEVSELRFHSLEPGGSDTVTPASIDEGGDLADQSQLPNRIR